VISSENIHSKWLKSAVILLLVLLIAGISSASTYLFLHENNEAEEGEPSAFSEMVAGLKLQAHDVIFAPPSPERNEAINDIGKKLKEILTSEYAELVTNDTFHSDEFTVTISAYPLQNDRVIRRIEFSIKNDENDIPHEERRFFLQHIGDTTYFTDIDYAFSEKDFQVFETKEGIFAFLLSCNEYDYTTYSSPQTLKPNYSATVYLPRENAFSVEKNIEIPLTIDTGSYIKLIQQNETIKSIVCSDSNDERPEGEPECIFNSSALSFESPDGNVISEPIDFDFPGLLLGLSDPKGNLRTLFIRKEKNKIRCNEYLGEIIFPRQKTLFSLKSYLLNEFMEEKTDGGEMHQTGALDIKKLLCAPLGTDQTADFKKIFYPKPEYGYYDFTDIPLYVGAEYVCYLQERSHSGGGTYHSGTSDIRFDKLDNLSKFTSKYEYDYDILTPNFKERTLADLIYGSKARDLYQSDFRTYGGWTNPYIDFRQLSIKRNLGKWSLMLPVMEDYHHPGNGSHGNWADKFAVYHNDVPDFLIADNDVMESNRSGGDWDANDLFRFPGTEIALYQYDYFIGIGSPENDGSFLKIPAKIDEYIVAIHFADDTDQKVWMDELNKLIAP